MKRFLASAGVGCHIAWYNMPGSEWTLGYYPLDTLDTLDTIDTTEPVESLPEISIDPEDGLLSAINTSATNTKCFYLTLMHPCINEEDEELAMGSFLDHVTDSNGHPVPVLVPCITFVLLLAPRHIMDICYIELPDDQPPALYSHITDLRTLPQPDLEPSPDVDTAIVLGFPLQGGPFLCTQSFNGEFTHFKAETYHAVDWRCPVGTPVLAVADGEVVEVCDTQTATGIHTQNLFAWNSIMLKLNSGEYVEYVHIKAKSAKVAVGEKVSAGKIICESGDVGFCPEPHLHLQVQASNDHKAETVRFCLEGADGKKYTPEAGCWYNSEGKAIK